MVNNSTNISKTNNYLSLLTLEHKNRLQHMTIEIKWRMMPVVQKYSPIIHSSVKTLWLIATQIWKYFCTYEPYNKCLSNRPIMLNDCYNCTAAATTKEVRNTGFGTRVMRRLTLVEQELPTLPEHLGSLSVFSEDGIAQSLVFCVECCVCLFFLSLYCLSSSIYSFSIKLFLFQNQTTNVHYYICNHCLSLLLFRFHTSRDVCDTFSFPFLQVHRLSPSIKMAVTISLNFLFKKCIILALLVFNLKKRSNFITW